ncbi:ATP-dependent nuclease [Rhodohalobacter mucosus]|uniref:Endonuclease GajA/Old nuclease/RecF-like AAA domain-containing protein n=1 Tax=Rhodohalobacter mucosus TaxID=2079485 RepID=A0A316TS24_9BACT|nr:AAA family ATPase [Rhodohalobacter mucosus]PWN06119.1 hypothetical protein DDZ15_09725 [Rhodohalobacter mucosus]
MIEKFSISNFRGIGKISDLNVGDYNILIGDNGTSKTSIIEALNHAFSPYFLANRIKHTDFKGGSVDSFSVFIKFIENLKVELPDGYTTQEIECDKLYLEVKKRDQKKAGKVLSDPYVVTHLVGPAFEREENGKGWKIKRKSGSDFKFSERSLTLSNISTEDLPRTFYFGKDRNRQLTKGFNSSFSNVVEDLNWRYNRYVRKDPDSQTIQEKIQELTNEIHKYSEVEDLELVRLLREKLNKFDIAEIDMSIFDSVAPYDSAFFSSKKGTLDLPVKDLGSGFEMIISLLFLETLASFSKEKLLILIDEPELHLHPKLQEKLADYLLSLSQESNNHQIFISTHSPIFYKNTFNKTGVKTFVTSFEDGDELVIQKMQPDSGLFPWSPSWGEINYKAYNYPTVEFHNELYGFIQEKHEKFKEKEIDDFFEEQGLKNSKQWQREQNGNPGAKYMCTLPVFIRNKIHHPENTIMQVSTFSSKELEESIESMIHILKK